MKNIHSMISMKMTQNKQPFSHLADELELMPELSDQYKGAEILSPRLDQMAMCQVVALSCGFPLRTAECIFKQMTINIMILSSGVIIGLFLVYLN